MIDEPTRRLDEGLRRALVPGVMAGLVDPSRGGGTSGRASYSTTPNGPESCTGSIVTASSAPAIDPILKLHLEWIIARKTSRVVYICGDEEGRRRIERAGRRVGLYPSSAHLRIELLDTIKAETVAAFESSRQAAEPTAT